MPGARVPVRKTLYWGLKSSWLSVQHSLLPPTLQQPLVFMLAWGSSLYIGRSLLIFVYLIGKKEIERVMGIWEQWW